MYRGISLSDDKPVARAALNYDGASGWFAGGQVVSGQLAVETHRSAQWTGYAGYAQRLPSGLSWETGVTAYAFPKNPNWNFREVFVGLSGDTVSAPALFARLSGHGRAFAVRRTEWRLALAPRLQAFWHGGYYHSLDNAQSSRSEARLGLASSYKEWRAQLSLDLVRLRGGQTTDIYGVTTGGGSEVRHVVVLTVARGF
jgi:uncharacterized protein (TIGR02001 family)